MHATLALFLMNVLPYPIKSHHFLSNYSRIRGPHCIHPYLDSKTASTMSLPQSSTPNSIAVTLSTYCNSLYCDYSLLTFLTLQFAAANANERSLRRAIGLLEPSPLVQRTPRVVTGYQVRCKKTSQNAIYFVLEVG